MDFRSQIRNLERRIKSIFSRGVLIKSNDQTLMREVDIRLLATEELTKLEHFEPYGFSSKAKEDAEVLCMFLHGSRSQGIVLVTADRRFRLNLEEGEVAIFDDLGQKVHLKRDGIEVYTPKNHKLLVDGSSNIVVKGNSTINVSGTCDINVGSNTKVTAPKVSIQSNVEITGSLKVGGGLAVSGGGGATVQGSLNATEDVRAGSISLQGHVHSGVQSGGSDTGVPK